MEMILPLSSTELRHQRRPVADTNEHTKASFEKDLRGAPTNSGGPR
jgi:hypothetical protein